MVQLKQEREGKKMPNFLIRYLEKINSQLILKLASIIRRLQRSPEFLKKSQDLPSGIWIEIEEMARSLESQKQEGVSLQEILKFGVSATDTFNRYLRLVEDPETIEIALGGIDHLLFENFVEQRYCQLLRRRMQRCRTPEEFEIFIEERPGWAKKYIVKVLREYMRSKEEDVTTPEFP